MKKEIKRKDITVPRYSERDKFHCTYEVELSLKQGHLGESKLSIILSWVTMKEESERVESRDQEATG